MLIHGDAGDENNKKDDPAGDDMGPMFRHMRAENMGQNENSSQPADTGKK